MRMRISIALLWVTGLLEAFLGIPFLGGSFVISTGYTALSVMFVLHAITLFFCFREFSPKAGPVLGLITSLVAIIPLVGMVMHWISAIVLLFSAATTPRRI